jgi:hypothetical protein
LIANLGNIRHAILETIQFVLRNVLVLRGVLLTTIFETVSAAARLAASIVAILGATLQSVLSSIVGMVGTILDAAFNALETLTSALQSVIRVLLQWLVTGLFNTLREIGNLSIFRTLDHFVRILPGLLEPIYHIVVAYRGQATTTGLPEDIRRRLNRAFDAGFATPGAAATGASGGATPGGAIAGSGPVATTEQIIGDLPPINTDIIAPLRATLSDSLQATGAQLQEAMRGTFDTAGGTLGQLAGRFDRAIQQEADFSRSILDQHASTLTDRADRLARAITAPIQAQSQPTGFEDIAAAYETWLTSGQGLNQILNLATSHFERAAVSGETGGTRSLLRGQFDRPRASVEIDRVEIVIDEPQPEPEEGGAALEAPLDSAGVMRDEDIWLAWHRHSIDLEERAVRPSDLRTLTT